MPRPSLAWQKAHSLRSSRAPEPFRYLHQAEIASIDEGLAILDAKERVNPLDHRIPKERAAFLHLRRQLAGEAWFQEWWYAIGAAESVAALQTQRDAMDARIDQDMTAEQIAAARKRLGLDD